MEKQALKRIARRLVSRQALPSARERRQIRAAAGVSQDELARMIGCHRNAIGRFERGGVPKGDLLTRYVRALDLLAQVAE